MLHWTFIIHPKCVFLVETTNRLLKKLKCIIFLALIQYLSLIFSRYFLCQKMNLEITSSPGFPAVYCGGQTKQSSKQSMMEAARFLQPVLHREPRDANEISHGLTVEEIELPCLLLDWRNALLMLWGEELNGEGGRDGGVVGCTLRPPH